MDAAGRLIGGPLLVVLLVLPAALGAFSWSQRTDADVAGQATFAPLRGGDKGTATLGASRASATVTVSDLAIQLQDDVLKASMQGGPWTAQVVYASHAGFTGLLTTFTVSLASDAGSATSIRITNGVPTITMGSLLDPTQGSTLELRAVASLGASGTLHLHLVFTQGTVEVREAVTLHVT